VNCQTDDANWAEGVVFRILATAYVFKIIYEGEKEVFLYSKTVSMFELLPATEPPIFVEVFIKFCRNELSI
jgi:hypothetical protein